MRLPRFHRLHIFFTGPFVLAGLLSILVVSIIAINAARSIMGRMAQDLATESLDGLHTRIQDLESFDFSLESIDTVLKEHFARKNAYGFISDGTGQLQGTSWISRNQSASGNTTSPANGFNHPDCLIRCSLRGAQNEFSHLNQIDGQSFLVTGDDGMLLCVPWQILVPQL